MKWVGFCEQDEGSVFPASEGDVIAYIGFLKLEGRVSAASLPQYLSAVSRYHELAGVASPTKTVLVRSLSRAYDPAFDPGALPRPTRVGLPAAVMRCVLALGLETPVLTLVRGAALVMFVFLFGCRASTAVSLRGSDIDVTDGRVTAVLVHSVAPRILTRLVRFRSLTTCPPRASRRVHCCVGPFVLDVITVMLIRSNIGYVVQGYYGAFPLRGLFPRCHLTLALFVSMSL
jgi:hypothetical protein